MFLRAAPHRNLKYLRIGVIGAAWLAAVFGMALGSASIALAQAAYPNKPIKLVVGFAAGGPSDIFARALGAAMSKTLGEQVFIENRAGASGNLATEAVARSEPDGYTMLLTTFSGPVNENLFKNFKIKFSEQFAPIAYLAETGLVLLVHPSLEVKSVPDLVKLAKEKPGDVLYATAGIGTATHLAAELFNFAAGTKMMPVHYKGGGETIKDILSGQVKVMFSTIPPVLGHVREGRLRGLATTGLSPDKVLPELKTISGSNYEVILWAGLSVAKGTPRPIVDRLAAAAQKALDDPDAQKTLAAQGYTLKFSGPEDFGKFYQNEVTKWSKVAEAIGPIGN
jgi:tripartite-type tricarboxylate transporter receptor subunit TctC